MTITLDALKAEQKKLADKIAAFEALGTTQAVISFPNEVAIALRHGEKLLGIVVSADGERREAIVLLPGDSEEAGWQSQMDWAASVGGKLPDRVEGALLFAHLKGEFKAEAYWTRTQHASDSDFAWYQTFDYGYQYFYPKSARLRARAVRSISI